MKFTIGNYFVLAKTMEIKNYRELQGLGFRV
jgi:hypothetical protein